MKKLKKQWMKFKEIIKRKKEERLTLMFIPHNEQKIKNIHISNLTLSIFVGLFTMTVVVSSVLIINHTSTIQEVDKLKISQKDAKLQFAKIREEIQNMEQTFSKVRSRLSQLHAMSQGKKSDEDNYFGQGGAAVPMDIAQQTTFVQNESADESVPMEIFMLNRIINDMEISEKPLKDIEKFLEKRKKIIQNTPTLWPVEGFIVNPYGFVRNADTLSAGFNAGIDIAATPGAKVISTAPGIVVEIKKDSKWLWSIRVRHNYGYETVYYGLDQFSVTLDEKIVKGETLGYLGKQKDSSESILHYQIFVGIDPQNPMPYLSFIND